MVPILSDTVNADPQTGNRAADPLDGESPAQGHGPVRVRLHHIGLEPVARLRSAHDATEGHAPDNGALLEGTIAHREVILVEVRDGEGNVGWGECPALPRPGYVAEYLDGCWAVLVGVFVPALVDAPDPGLDYLAGAPGHAMARGALLDALVDRDLRIQGRSLADALGEGRPRAATVRSNAVVGIHETLGALEVAVERALAAGHRSVKLKIEPGRDVDAARAIRNLWPELTIAVDANASYGDARSAVDAIGRLDEAAGPLAYVEQPLAADDLVGLALVRRSTDTPIVLDESLTTLGSAVTAVSLRAIDMANIKPARVGGSVAAMGVARFLEAEGIPVFCGGMIESGVGRAGALAFAAQSACVGPADLGPSSAYHVRDVTESFELVDGCLKVPDGPGIGVAPNPDVLAASTIRTWSYP